MLKELSYSVVFPTPNPGRSFAGHFKFEPGVTAVTGPNGSAKSLGTIEMARYGLFGKDALRGPATDYKNLEMWMEFEVLGQAYRVERGKKERLLDSTGDVLAVKASAVNTAIEKILGYGLDVFDIVNACNQKESERLSKLKPAERKRLIDEVVGLSQNEEVEKACKAEATALNREADALAANLPTVPEVVEPVGYRPSAELQIAVEQARASERQRADLQALAVLPAPPSQPVEGRVDLVHIEKLADEARAHNQNNALIKQRLNAIPVARYTQEEIRIARQRLQYQTTLSLRGPEPELDLTKDRCQVMLDTYAQYRALVALPDVETECPNCQHHFHTRPELPELPSYSTKQLEDHMARLEKHSEKLELPPEGPDLNLRQIMDAEQALALAPERAQLLGQVVDDMPVPDVENARRIARIWDRYDSEFDHYRDRLVAAGEAEARLNALPPQRVSAESLAQSLIAARVYEGALVSSEALQSQRDVNLALITEKREAAVAFKAGASALAGARTEFKAHLTPALSRIATTLITQMTGGALQDVVVDEDMNVTVAGQEVSTLSGAGATAANLALRLGLGRVLVSKVFPVFIGDEIDSDMDATRAQQNAECLANIEDMLQQVILISHKSLENVDHKIELT